MTCHTKQEDNELSDLTPKQQKFIDEYLVDLNATQAAIRAGYSEKTAAAIAGENLSKPMIREGIQKAFEDRANRTKTTQDRVVLELARIAFASIGTMATWSGDNIVLVDSETLSDDDKAAIQEITKTETPNGPNLKIKLADKLNALEKLGRHLGMFQGKKFDVSPEEKKVLEDFMNGELDVIAAATEYAKLGKPLPDVLRLQLSKLPAPEPEEDDAGVFSEEELDAKFQEQMERIQEQKEKWRPERQQEIRKIKDDLADKSQWEKTD
jgi:phage terminase small subunit